MEDLETRIATFSDKLTEVKSLGWQDRSIETLIGHLNGDLGQKLNALLRVLDIIIVYNLREYDTGRDSDEDILQILQHSPVDLWGEKVHQIAIFQKFPGTYVKKLDELISEICELNGTDLPLLQGGKLEEEYLKIITAYGSKSVLGLWNTPIKSFTKEIIQQWAAEVKNPSSEKANGERASIYEMIAVVKRAVKLTSKRNFSPRIIQLLSLLLLLNTEKGKGRLMQINTGEGKTTIIAMFAAIKALQGHKNDISTSSSELAKPQSKQQKMFFSCLGLDVAHVEHENGRIQTDNYAATTIYGSASTLQADVLRDDYAKRNSRKGRVFDVGIVDEVDSMLIDGKNHIVMLSCPMPGLNCLEPLLAAIWYQLGHTADRICERGGITYYVECRSEFVEAPDEELVQDYAVPLETTKEDFLIKSVDIHMRKMLRDVTNLPSEEIPIPETYPKIEIPKHLREFVIEVQLAKWIDSAIRAKYKCENGKDYIIRDRKIAPVDAANTGNVQLNMIWSNGVHQFLQIKHGSKITAESLTTNFISNVTYFNRFGENLYGVTGTLGSKAARRLLHDVYKVDSIIIPPFQKKQFLELRPVITYTKEDWYRNIAKSSLIHLVNGRAVLIITKYIEDAGNIVKTFIESFHFNPNNIRRYVTDEDSNAVEGELNTGQLIIATNIAGRGTDIKPSSRVEENGGLHVCVTFLPVNKRVEEQNFGRTSRTGNKGTAQFVLLEAVENNIVDLKRTRDEREEIALRTAEKEIEKVFMKDEIFQKFCSLQDEVKEIKRKKECINKDFAAEDNRDKNNFTDWESSEIVNNELRAVEERFGIWLKMNENIIDHGTKQVIWEKFNLFRSEILADAEECKVTKNPFYYILNGNQFVREEKYEEAEQQYTEAIKMDYSFMVNAYYHRAFARIARFGMNPKKHRKQIEEAIEDLKEAKVIIENILEPMLLIISCESRSEALLEQIGHKRTLLAIQKDSIELAVGYNVFNFMRDLENKKSEGGISKDEIDVIDKTIQQCVKNEKEYEKGVIRKTIEMDTKLELEMKDVKEFLHGENVETYAAELDEYRYNGFLGYLHVAGQSPIDWYPVSLMATFGLAQICAGACIIFISGGVAGFAALTIVAHGVDDIITAVRDGIIDRRKINWTNWGIHKAVSLVVSIACCGLGTIGKIAQRLAAGARQAVIGAAAITKQAAIACFKSIAKKLSGTVLRGIAKELFDCVTDMAINGQSFSLIKDAIFGSIQNSLRNNVRQNDRVNELLELDVKNRNDRYQTAIVDKIDEMISQKFTGNWWGTMLESAKGSLRQCGYPTLSMAMPIANILLHLNEFCELFPKWLKPSVDKIIYGIEIDEDADEQNVSPMVQTGGHFHGEEVVNHGDLDLALGMQAQEQITLERIAKSPDELADRINTRVSKKITEVIRDKVIEPLVMIRTRSLSEKLTKEFHISIKTELQSYRKERRIVFPGDDVPNNINVRPFEKEIHGDIEAANALIESVRNDKPTGLYYLEPLSFAIGRLLIVLNNKGKIVQLIGQADGTNPICVEYHQQGEELYWTLPGRREPGHRTLFGVVASQVGEDPNRLREQTAQLMEYNVHLIAMRLQNEQILNFGRGT